MMATGDAGAGIDGHVAGWEDILPAPCGGRLRVFALEGIGQVHRPMALRAILLVQCFDPHEVVVQKRDKRGGKGGAAIFLPFPRPDGALLHGPIDVLDAEPDGFHDA
jgi:hypothetical protein